MNKRPLSVTILGLLFAGAGVIGLAYHLNEFKTLSPFPYDVFWVCLVRLLAILGGVFMLRGRNWARWLTLAWIAYHVVLSYFHTVQELVAHLVLLAVFAFFLFRPAATEYFRGRPLTTGH
jgi:hypothetical protein